MGEEQRGEHPREERRVVVAFFAVRTRCCTEWKWKWKWWCRILAAQDITKAFRLRVVVEGQLRHKKKKKSVLVNGVIGSSKVANNWT